MKRTIWLTSRSVGLTNYAFEITLLSSAQNVNAFVKSVLCTLRKLDAFAVLLCHALNYMLAVYV